MVLNQSIKIVVDTNVLIRGIFNHYSYLEFKYGHAGYNDTSLWDDRWADACLNSCLGGSISLVTSPALRFEYIEIINRQKIANEDIKKDVASLLSLIEQSESVNPSELLSVCRDPDDNRILECAIAANADFIVTEDNDLLCLKTYNDIPIVRPKDIIQIIRKARFGEE